MTEFIITMLTAMVIIVLAVLFITLIPVIVLVAAIALAVVLAGMAIAWGFGVPLMVTHKEKKIGYIKWFKFYRY